MHLYNPIRTVVQIFPHICNKIYAFPTIFYVASKPSYVKLRHRFIFVRELRPNSTFHNCGTKKIINDCHRNHFVFSDNHFLTLHILHTYGYYIIRISLKSKLFEQIKTNEHTDTLSSKAGSIWCRNPINTFEIWRNFYFN